MIIMIRGSLPAKGAPATKSGHLALRPENNAGRSFAFCMARDAAAGLFAQTRLAVQRWTRHLRPRPPSGH